MSNFKDATFPELTALAFYSAKHGLRDALLMAMHQDIDVNAAELVSFAKSILDDEAINRLEGDLLKLGEVLEPYRKGGYAKVATADIVPILKSAKRVTLRPAANDDVFLRAANFDTAKSDLVKPWVGELLIGDGGEKVSVTAEAIEDSSKVSLVAIVENPNQIKPGAVLTVSAAEAGENAVNLAKGSLVFQKLRASQRLIATLELDMTWADFIGGGGQREFDLEFVES